MVSNITSQQNNQTIYRKFYDQHPEICVFSSPWWLDAAAGEDNWNVIIIENKNGIIATFPYMIKKSKLGFKYIGNPILTQKLGPFILYDKNISPTKKITYEHEVYKQIIEKLPKYDKFQISFDQKYKNWLPFYWSGFTQQTRYSYRINNIKDHTFVFNNIAKYKRQKIQKAENLKVFYDLPVSDFYSYFKEVVDERGDDISYSLETLELLVDSAYKNNQGRIIYTADENKRIHAIAFLIWDKECAYYLSAMRKKEFNTSGGTELLVYESIKYVSQFVDVFDFEGSMIEGVESSFRWYGANQTEYYQISKYNNKYLELASAVLKFLKTK